MSDARGIRNFGIERFTCTQTVTAYELLQTPSGKAGFYDSAVAANSGDTVEVQTSGTAVITKAAGFVALKGGRAYWDKSASAISYKKVNDRDFYAGRFAEDYLVAGATSCAILLNEDPPYDLDLARDPYLSVLVGTPAAGGFNYPVRLGGAIALELSSTNEAQKVDALGVDGFDPVNANAIIEFAFRVMNDGAGANPDFNIGVANGTHASDADSIAQAILLHLDGNNVNINAQSKDGTTTVAATDTTIDYTEGSDYAKRVEGWLDMRDPTDVQLYINGANALPASVFKCDAGTAPWYLLAHLEKTAAADVYKAGVDWLRARFAEQ
jgi:hypothetical protein